jgi:hypothetical protein
MKKLIFYHVVQKDPKGKPKPDMPNTSHMKRNLDLIAEEAAAKKAADAAADKAAEREYRKNAELARHDADQKADEARKARLASNREGKHIKLSALGKPALGVCTTASPETPEQRRARIEDRKAAAAVKAIEDRKVAAKAVKIVKVTGAVKIEQSDGKLMKAPAKPQRQRNANFDDKCTVANPAALDTSTLFNPANPFNAPTKVARQ